MAVILYCNSCWRLYFPFGLFIIATMATLTNSQLKLFTFSQYCILSWGFKSDRIFKLQKRAVRIITCSKHNPHTEPLLKILNLLKIEDIMKTKALNLYYRYKRNELPKYFESMFTESNDNHSHDTKHKSLLYMREKGMFKELVNSLFPGETCMRQWTRSASAPVMACCLYGAKTLPKQILASYQFGP